MEAFGMSDIGRIRLSNQDVFSYLILLNNRCFAFVCDGMGGQNRGEVASGIVKDIFFEKISKILKKDVSFDDIKYVVFDCYKKANEYIFKKACIYEDLKGMGTTCVTAIIFKKQLMLFSVGDSRAYIFSDERLRQLTVDHSYVQNLVDIGIITKEQAKTHPRKNEITKAVGIHENIGVDFKNLKLRDEDILLLCTDRLTNSCSDDTIADILRGDKNIKSCVKTLIDISNFDGGHDNITAVLIRV